MRVAKAVATAFGFSLGLAVAIVAAVGLETLIIYYILTGLVGVAVTPLQVLGGVLIIELLKPRSINLPQLPNKD